VEQKVIFLASELLTSKENLSETELIQPIVIHQTPSTMISTPTSQDNLQS